MSRNRRISLLCLSFVPILCADQVVLKNGDIITGSVVKKDGAKLTIKSEFLGEVTMPWTAVKSLKSDQDLTVVLPGGEAVLGKVQTEGDRIEVAGAGGTKSAPLAEVGAMRNAAEQHGFDRLAHPGFLELWAGSFELGLAAARGNARTTTLTNSFRANRVTRRDKITVTFNEIYAKARVNDITSTTASAVRGGWSYSRDLTPRFFVSTLNDYEHDRFQSLDLRFVLGGAFGVNAIKTDRTNLSFLGGGDYEHEDFTNHLSRDSGEANFGDDFLYKVNGSTGITQSLRFFPNLTNTGEYRLTFDLGGATVVKKWLSWTVGVSDRFVSNPVFGRERNDLLLSTGFRVSFAK